MAHDVAALQNWIDELEQWLERKDVHIEALTAEVIRLRRWRFGRSAARPLGRDTRSRHRS